MDILKRSIKILCSGLDLDNEQRFYFLSKFLKNDDPDMALLKAELNQVIADEQFDLMEFLAENDEILENPEMYSREELINYLKIWLWDYLYPENVLTQEQQLALSQATIDILKRYSDNDRWMFSYDLFRVLRSREEFRDLEYYNMWKIDFNEFPIERRSIEGKDQEIGFLRITE